MTDAIFERNQSILQDHQHGFSNAAIGQAYNLHPGQIARIIRQMKKAKTAVIPHDPTLRKNGRPLTNREREKKFGIEVGPKPRPKREAKPKREKQKRQSMSLLDASVIVLQKHCMTSKGSTPAMSPQGLVDTAVDRGLWKLMAGATPHATLWSRILSEIKKGPKVSRFRKVKPGVFGLTSIGRKWVAE